MIRYIRSVSVNQGKFPQASKMAVELAAYMNEHFPGHNMRAHVQVMGDVNKLHWISEYESIAQIEQLFDELHADDGYMNFWRHAAEQDLFVPGTMRDKAMKEL